MTIFWLFILFLRIFLIFFIKGANHFGIAGYYSMKAAKRGLIVSFACLRLAEN
jgi:hypothetical protein